MPFGATISSPDDLPDDVEGFARTIVYDRLAVSARSRADLEQALAKKHVPAEVAAAVLDRFEEAGLVDDESVRLAFRGFGEGFHLVFVLPVLFRWTGIHVDAATLCRRP